MAAKKSVSPGPVDLMKEIMRLIAEPNSVNNKKRLEVAYFQHPSKEVDPTSCDLCSNSSGFVCSSQYDKCLNNQNKYEDVRLQIKNIFDFQFPYDPSESFLEEVPIQRKYNVKLPARKQLDKLKMIRKNDRCVVCKKGILQGRLVQCHYCIRLYHLNCLDPPIRDWDHSMRWICPAHENFFELAYPDIFTPGSGLLANRTFTTKRTRCELPSLPVDKSFNIPSKIDTMYKKPEDNVPTTSNENSSLNILCDVATLALKSMNAENANKINDMDISDKLMQKNNSLPPKICGATLTCLSVPLKISVQKEVITIGKSHKNKLCLQPYGNCEYISDYHATIRFDKKTGDFILKNLSRFGVIVDNVSYFGNRRKPSNNHELKKVNSELLKHINKQRKTVQKDKIIHVAHNSDDEKPIIKYAGKAHGFNYRPMSKYYLSKYKNTKHGYKKPHCKCSKRLIQTDGYSGFAILRNESIILIGCMKFKFTYDSDILEILTKVDKKPLKNKNKPQETGINLLIDTINNLNSISIDEKNCSLKDVNITNSNVSENIMHDNNNIQPLEMNNSEISDTEYLKQWNIMDTMSSKQSCFASDLIQEVEVNESEDCEIIEEEIVYEMNYAEADNCAPVHINDDQEWEIEEIVIGEDRNFNSNGPLNSTDLQLKSSVELPVAACNGENYKTEHMYCARGTSYNDTIVISDDDEDDNNETDDYGVGKDKASL